jgi:hypothetical protein
MIRSLIIPLLAACTLGFVSTVSGADKAPLVVTTGKSGGGYHTIGQNLEKVLAEQDIAVDVITSVGSLENLKRLNDPEQPASVGLTQADALKYYLDEHADFAEQLLILGEIGKECVFIITGDDSDIDSDADLQKKHDRLIAVQDMNSGVAVTYQYMMTLEPGFRNTPPAFIDSIEALLALKSGSDTNRVQAVMLVQRPSARSDEMRVVLENPDIFRFIPVKDWDLNDKLPDGSAVYSHETVTIEERRWGFDKSVDTICTRGLLIAAKNKLDSEQRSRLARVMLMAEKRIIGDMR